MHGCMAACAFQRPRIPETPLPMDSLLAPSSSSSSSSPPPCAHHNSSSSSSKSNTATSPLLMHTTRYAQDAMPPPPLLGTDTPYKCAKQHAKAAPPGPVPGLCTEGLGSESSDEVDVGLDDVDMDAVDAAPASRCKRQHCGDEEEDEEQQVTVRTRTSPAPAVARTKSGRVFPPPISVIGTSGRPRVYLRAHRQEGRLVLQEMRIPQQELLQSWREHGRLKLQFAHPEEGELEASQEQHDAVQEHQMKE